MWMIVEQEQKTTDVKALLHYHKEMQLVEPLAKDFPELSIDAEANLRDPNDNLDLDLAQDYLRQAFVMFGD